jgi:Holliday junction resolvase RusA-like endonuclease
MGEQDTLPTLGWPALVAGPVFLCFEISGKPGHKARHRSRLMIPREAWIGVGDRAFIPKVNVKKIFIQQYPDPDTEAYEKMIREYAGLLMNTKRLAPTEKPVALLVHSFRPVPQSWSKSDQARALAGHLLPTSRPDGDNYLKVIQDALNETVWHDDSQVVDARIIKRYDSNPGMRVEIREMSEP